MLNYLAVFICLLIASLTSAASLDEARLAIRTKQYVQAHEILLNLANSGNSEAQYLLSTFYSTGKGTKKDAKATVRWLQVAANQNHLKAQYALGTRYERGIGVTQNTEQAIFWYQKSSAQGHRKATEKLSSLLSTKQADNLNEKELRQQLFLTVRNNDLYGLEKLLDRQLNLNIANDYDKSLLETAIYANNYKAVSLLLSHGASVNYKTPSGSYPLLVAAKLGHCDIIKSLLSNKTHIDQQNVQGNSALHLAVRGKHPACVKELLNAKANPNITNKKGNTSLDFSSKANSEIAQILKRYGGKSGISKATSRTNKPTAQALLKNSERLASNLNQKDNPFKNWPTLNIAAWRGQHDVVAALIVNGIDINSLDPEQHTPLSRASWQGHADIVDQLLAAGANPNHRLPDGNTAIRLAAVNRHAHVVKSLLDANVSLNIPDFDNEPLLIAVIKSGDENIALELLNYGAASNSYGVAINATYKGKSTLMWAALEGFSVMTRELVSKGVAINAQDTDGRTALWLAISAHKPEVAKTLLQLKADLTITDYEGNSPLAIAAKSGQNDTLQALLNYGANVDALNVEHNTSLILAASNGQSMAVKTLIENGAKLSLRNKTSHTALMLAAKNGHLSTVKILLKNDADPERKNRDGKNTLDLAQYSGHRKTAKFIKAFNSENSLFGRF